MSDFRERLKDKGHVIWDWNGTLLCDIDLAVNTTNRLLCEANLPPMSLEKYREIFRFPVIDYYRELGLDTSELGFSEICERFNTYFHDQLGSCDLWPGARALLAHVKASGKRQSLLSASEQMLLNSSVKLFELTPYFDHVYGIADKKAGSKVNRGHELMEMAGVKAKDTIMIGDTDHDLEVGQALGIDVILVEHGHQHGDRLRNKHHTVVKLF